MSLLCPDTPGSLTIPSFFLPPTLFLFFSFLFPAVKFADRASDSSLRREIVGGGCDL